MKIRLPLVTHFVLSLYGKVPHRVYRILKWLDLTLFGDDDIEVD